MKLNQNFIENLDFYICKQQSFISSNYLNSFCKIWWLFVSKKFQGVLNEYAQADQNYKSDLASIFIFYLKGRNYYIWIIIIINKL